MDIKTLSELAKVADLCRKKGIESIKITADAIEFKLGDRPTAQKRGTRLRLAGEESEPAPQYTEEEILNWSVNQVGGQ